MMRIRFLLARQGYFPRFGNESLARESRIRGHGEIAWVGLCSAWTGNSAARRHDSSAVGRGVLRARGNPNAQPPGAGVRDLRGFDQWTELHGGEERLHVYARQKYPPIRGPIFDRPSSK